MVYYMLVTKDKYELPLAVAESPGELAKMIGVTKGSILSSLSHAKVRRQNSPYKRIEFDDKEEEEE